MKQDLDRLMEDCPVYNGITPLEVSIERKGAGIAPIVAEDSLEFLPLEEGGRGHIGSK